MSEKINVNDFSYVLMKFRRGEIKLYTKKNQDELIELNSVADVKRYMFRLYR